MSEILYEELESFEPQSRREVARALRQALIYLQCEASDTGMPFTERHNATWANHRPARTAPKSRQCKWT